MKPMNYATAVWFEGAITRQAARAAAVAGIPLAVAFRADARRTPAIAGRYAEYAAAYTTK